MMNTKERKLEPPSLTPQTSAAVSALEQMWARIDSIHAQQQEQIPEGAITVREYAEHYGVTHGSARYFLDARLADGTMKYAFRLRNGHRERVFWDACRSK